LMLLIGSIEESKLLPVRLVFNRSGIITFL